MFHLVAANCLMSLGRGYHMALMAHCRYVTAQRSACPGQHCGIWPISIAPPGRVVLKGCRPRRHFQRTTMSRLAAPYIAVCTARANGTRRSCLQACTSGNHGSVCDARSAVGWVSVLVSCHGNRFWVVSGGCRIRCKSRLTRICRNDAPRSGKAARRLRYNHNINNRAAVTRP